ncbi:YcaO-like family protein [Lysinibacillus xylanilyticus]|uniref:YcaO domain-containing protein n=1 Tax=Lysinibacillus xylanilyticus TaxID=582475 RepID=A0A2M9Q5S3_9BACI|nr:YcaO-like family protein [Lysinibacillus xylanilyticus]PJO43418.1 hypothetical protein CWD94_12780 [Lysinibacillus xylanilyticus]
MFSVYGRIKSHEETLNWIKPLSKNIGITRTAEVTWLDQIGLPVYQAIRPLSKNYIVSQGKGLTKEQAEISALMESIELYHAEDIPVNLRETINGMRDYLCYNPYDLEKQQEVVLNEEIPIDWALATNLVTNENNWIPKDLICLDFSVKSELIKMPFRVTSNGLASGNCKEEALIHGLLEVIERDCITNSEKLIVNNQCLPNSIITWIEKLGKLGHHTRISLLKNTYNIPCFEVSIRQFGKQIAFTGTACHLNKEMALFKALTEAIQSRLTFITGSRDDIREESYKRYKKNIDDKNLLKFPEEYIQFNNITEICFKSSIEEQLDYLIKLVSQTTKTSPLYVNLTKEEFNIPVYFVVVPKLSFKVRH